jgi:hypothetical protein
MLDFVRFAVKHPKKKISFRILVLVSLFSNDIIQKCTKIGTFLAQNKILNQQKLVNKSNLKFLA